jgi:hypothetical protein
VRSCRTAGAVRGVLGNRHPTRDHPQAQGKEALPMGT